MSHCKKISQETFDAAVRENMEEFDMSAQEALENAILEFGTQHVDLRDIVQDASLYGEGASTEHPVITAIKNLQNATAAADPEQIRCALKNIREQCSTDLAQRVLAAANQGWEQCLAACQFCNNLTTDIRDHCLQESIDTLCDLCNGQPDIVTNAGRELFVSLLKSEMSCVDTCSKVIRLIKVTCVMHEANRQAYVQLGLVEHLVGALEMHKLTSADVVKESCAALRILATDDDMRATFGKAHDHAKLMVTEHKALARIMETSKIYTDNEIIMAELFATLSRLAVRNEFCQEIHDLGGLPIMIDALNNHSSHQVLCRQAMFVLKSMAGNDDVKRAIVSAGGIELIVATMTKHARHAGVQEGACAALATIALRIPDNAQRIVTSNGAEAVVNAMRLHPTVSAVQKQGSMCVRNLVSRCEDLVPQLLELGVESVLSAALQEHATCKDEARAALRDLGCQVNLQELWKGEGKSLQQ